MSKIWHFLRRLPSYLAIFLIRCYQLLLSPLLGSRCRFTPTCSAYGAEAFRVHGFLKGFRLTARRFLACRPGGRSGYDPVPEKTAK